jgi:hypothetical protein
MRFPHYRLRVGLAGPALLLLFAVFAAGGWAADATPAGGLAAEAVDGGVRVSVAGSLFTVYKTDASLKYPYFFPVNGPLSGEPVTTETSEPYPHHHSLFFGCDKVNGGNYWQEGLDRGQIVSEGVDILQDRGGKVVFRDRCRWVRPGKDPVIRDERTITVSAPSDTVWQIDFDIVMTPQEEVRIEQTNHSLFSARMVPELSVKLGGTLVNAAGDRNEEGTFGKPSPWADYSGARGGKAEGLAILQHPENPWHPAPWFTRDYGFFSPTPMFWPENGKHTDLPKGKPVRLRYRVLVHAGGAEEAGIAAAYGAYLGEK